MFSKTALASIILGALYVNALTIPVARSPVPEPEFQGLTARVNFESAKREIFDDLLSREPEDWVHESKREPGRKEPPPPCPQSKREPGRAVLATPPTVCTLTAGSPAPPAHKHHH